MIMQVPGSGKRGSTRPRRYASASGRVARGSRREGPHPQPIAPPPSVSSKKQPKLMDEIRTAVRARNYSIRTERTYVDWAYRYILFHDKQHPAELGAADINRFLSHLATDLNVAASTQNQALNAVIVESYTPSPPDPGAMDPETTRQHPDSPLTFLKRIGIAALCTLACLVGRRPS